MKISKELMKGSTAALVLSVLKNQDLYGYKIIKEIALRSDDVFVLKEGTLYPILHALEEEGCLESYWQESDNRKRKQHRHTGKGDSRRREKKEEWQTYSKSVERVLSFAN